MDSRRVAGFTCCAFNPAISFLPSGKIHCLTAVKLWQSKTIRLCFLAVRRAVRIYNPRRVLFDPAVLTCPGSLHSGR